MHHEVDARGGVAFGTTDEGHLLNVPASGMSALPQDPAHFVSRGARQDPHEPADPGAFVSRSQFAHYLDDRLTEALASTDGLVSVRHVRDGVTAIRRTTQGAEPSTWSAATAPGPRTCWSWAPA